MKQLPIGVYAVSETFTEHTVNFSFQGQHYEAALGENAFSSFEALSAQSLLCVQTPFCGYCGTPVILLPSGICRTGEVGQTKEERFRIRFTQAVTILGANAGVSPNSADLRTAAPRAEESVIQGSTYFGSLAMEGSVSGSFILDGITIRTRVIDERTSGENAALTVKNCILDAPLGRHLIYAGPEFAGTRQVTVSDCRADGVRAMEGEGSLICVCSGNVTAQRIYMANTEKFLGMSNYARTIFNNVSQVTLRDSLFENSRSFRGFTVNVPEDGICHIRVENCEFLNFTPENDPVITANLPGCSTLTVTGTRIVGTGNVPAILIIGNPDAVTLTDTVQEGFRCLCDQKPPRRTTPDATADYTPEDPHMPLESPDFSSLDAMYAGRQPFHGDFHCHSNSGGTSDGKFPIEDYVPTMKEIGLDFAAIVDHKQMRHYFLPQWDEQYLICGSEPGCTLNEPDRPADARGLHYTMIFPDKTGLAQVLGAFPEFEFTGKWDGQFKYPRLTWARMVELAEYIYSIGGLLSHAHPKQVMVSNNPLDYYFGEHVPLETIHGSATSFSTLKNRELWIKLLLMGKRVRTHGSSDSHGPVSNRGLTTVYAPRHYSTDIFNVIRSGDCTAGAIGIQMCIGDTPMGSVAQYIPGKTLLLRVDNFHPAHKLPDTVYSLKVYTDQGLAWATEFDGSALAVALPVQDRRFYRVEVINESDGQIVALSNPIWLEH